jgi:gas vesicle protein
MDLLTGIIIGCLIGLVFMLIAIPTKRVLQEKKEKKKELENNSNSNFDLG